MKNFLRILLLFICLEGYGQAPSIEWQRCYGSSNHENGLTFCRSTDGGYLLVGVTVGNDSDVTGNHGSQDAWVVKIDSMGVIQWQRCYGGTYNESFNAVQSVPWGGYILAGYTESEDGDVSGFHGTAGNSIRDFWVVKIDSAGTIEWQKCMGGFQSEQAMNVLVSRDSGFVVSGWTLSISGDVTGNHGSRDYWVAVLDLNGNLLRQNCYGGGGDDKCYSVVQTADNKFVCAGTSASTNGDVTGNHGLNDIWVIKIDTGGTLLWEKSYGGSLEETGYRVDVLESAGGPLIVSGSTASNDGDVTGHHSGDDAWVFEVPANGGNLTFQKCLGGSSIDHAFGIAQTDDGGFVVACESASVDGDVSGTNGATDFWLVKLDSTFTIEWQICVGGTSADYGPVVAQMPDGGFFLSGTTWSNDGDVSGNNGSQDIWAVKLSAPTADVENPGNPFTDFAAYVNSAGNTLLVSFYANGKETAHVQLLDIDAKEILSQTISASGGFNRQKISTGDLKSGMYVVRLTSGERSVTKKVFVFTKYE